MNIARLPKYIDLIFCLIVLPAIVAIFPVERWAQNFPVYMTCVGIWLYALYFINRKLVVPRLLRTDWHSLSGWIILIVSLVITGGLASVNLFTPEYTQFDDGLFVFLPRLRMYQQAVICWFLVVVTFSFVIGLLQETYQERMRRKEMEGVRDREVITQLLARIKPHFMFNTLNTLYGLFLTEDPAALPSLAKYISMLQYIHRASDTLLVPLSDEVQYIREYIDLQSLRLNGKTRVRFEAKVENDALQIPPLLLVTFVENCFKYGVSSIEESVIHISIKEEDCVLVFRTDNRIFTEGVSGTRSGLENCRQRLAISFPGRYTLKIKENGGFYAVDLRISFVIEPGPQASVRV